MQQDPTLPPDLTRRLARRERLTRAGLWVERLVRALWPSLALLLVLWAGVRSGALGELPARLSGALAVGVLTGALVLAVLGLRQVRRPTVAEALARMDAHLPGRPLAALSDRPVLGGDDQGARALWAAHRQRMAARAAGARAVAPTPDLAPRDPFGLRIVALALALTVGLTGGLVGVTGQPGSWPRLWPGARQAAVSDASWEGWAEPPGYTGKPPLYLPRLAGDAVSLPDGTKISLRLYGRAGDLALDQSVGTADAAAPADRPGVTVTRSGRLTVTGPGGRSWEVTLIPDAPPTVMLTGPLGRKADGSLQLPFVARDDYGVVKGVARVTLDLSRVERRFGLAVAPDPRPDLTLDLPRPARGAQATKPTVLSSNQSQHPWASLPVLLTLTVTDARGQTGMTGPLLATLPGRRFYDPDAAALIEVRRDLLWSMENGPRGLKTLRALAAGADGGLARPGAYLELRAIIARLAASSDAAARDEAAEALWTLAVKIEEGITGDAKARLSQVQERLKRALDQGAPPEDVARLMDELRQATRDYLQALADEAQGQDQAGSQGPTQSLDARTLQAMMDEIERLSAEGRSAEAAQRLAQLNALLENLKITQGGGGQGGSQGGGQGGGPTGKGGQAMQGLRDTLKGQQDLSDRAFREQQDRYGQGQSLGQEMGQGQGSGQGSGQDSGQGSEGTGTRPGDGQQSGGADDLARRQEELRRELDRARGALPADAADGEGRAALDSARRSLDQAGQAMDQAADALRSGDLPGALQNQAQALSALRQGMKDAGQALDPQQADQGGGAAGSALGQAPDPLGRTEGGAGIADPNAAIGTAPSLTQRARDLLDELRRKAAEQDRPRVERDYLRRLIDEP